MDKSLGEQLDRSAHKEKPRNRSFVFRPAPLLGKRAGTLGNSEEAIENSRTIYPALFFNIFPMKGI